MTATDGTSLSAVEEATLAQLDAVRRHGITEQELQKAKNQLRARLVFEGDSISNIAHQLGYFETIASWRLVPSLAARIDAVTLQQVAEAAARLPQERPIARSAGSIRSRRRDEGAAPVGEGASAGPARAQTR